MAAELPDRQAETLRLLTAVPHTGPSAYVRKRDLKRMELDLKRIFADGAEHSSSTELKVKGNAERNK